MADRKASKSTKKTAASRNAGRSVSPSGRPATSSKPPAHTSKPPASSSKPPASSSKPPATSSKPPRAAKPTKGKSKAAASSRGQTADERDEVTEENESTETAEKESGGDGDEEEEEGGESQIVDLDDEDHPAPRKGGTVAGSLHTPVRTPERAEELKAKIGALAAATNQIKALKRSLPKSFYEVGLILQEIRTKRLFEVKGYGSFEAFVEREIDLGKQLSLRIMRISQTFLREAAIEAGLERTTAALAALEGEDEEPAKPNAANVVPSRSPIPPHKR